MIQQFFHAESNQRTDQYGGDVAARARFACELLGAVRAEVGPGFPLLMGLSQFAVNDFEWVTWANPDELAVTVGALRAAGADGFHVAAHRIAKAAFGPQDDPAGHGLAWHVRHLSGLPTAAVGGVTYTASIGESLMGAETALADPAEAAQALADGDADLISVGRAMLANPDWAAKVRAGRWRDLVPFRREMLAELL